MREAGIFVQILGKVTPVRVERPARCAGCSCCIELAGPSKCLIEAENNFGAAMGEWVEYEIPAQQLLSHSSLAFLLPLFFAGRDPRDGGAKLSGCPSSAAIHGTTR
ncbi:MAG TPA: SoxR reducing system RseC family protein [bacterium]|nr:SoxR reducing system RseC family protein [bacterium]HQG44431.1 SoxR reducing system RseC family protein [bacterium]HQI47685.1 SoxR reducing system RseC family protein [bacterium]HQJ63457.1 SoxR reducing system RseC family protein [bacterium]